jgi:rod shape-determining protein MreC
MASRNNKRRTWIYVAALGLLVLLSAFRLLWPFQRAAATLLDPVLRRLQAAGVAVGTLYRDQANRRERAVEVATLQDEVARLTANNAELRHAAEENALLREQLKFSGGRPERYTLANVISRGDPLAAVGPTQTIVIDRGGRDGLVVGMPVLSETGVLVGKIAQVQDGSAQVRLTNHRDCKVAATVLGADGLSGITEGERGLTVAMRFIPQTAKIAVGDLVVSAGLEEHMPRGLAIGTVTAVQRAPNDVWQSATVQPLVDPDRLLIISIPR